MAKRTPAFGLFSISFGGTNEPALPMRDLQSNLVLGATPEWVSNRRSAPVAYPRGASPHLSVVFQAANIDVFPKGKRFTIEASGGGLAVVPQRVPLAMSPGKPLSDPIVFPFTAPIKGGIGIRTITLKWSATDDAGDTFSIGTSSHTMYVTWEPAPACSVTPFAIVVQTACDAAAGQSTVKGIAGALVDAINELNLARSQSVMNVRTALLQKAANSGGFSAMLVQMLASQGIAAETRAISVDWQQLPAIELEWVPTASVAPPVASGPGVHCLTLIPGANGVLLCDAYSGIGPVAMAMPLPKDEAWTLTGPVFAKLLKEYLAPAAKRRRRWTKPIPGPSIGAVTPFSVHFRFPGSAAIVLRDVVQDVEIGQTPEWVAGMDNFQTSEGPDDLGPPPAAYIRGETIAMDVTFLRSADVQDGGAPSMVLTIGATGPLAGVTAQRVTLIFDADGRSSAQRFTLDRVIANDVGQATLTLEWYVTSSPGVRQPIGTSTHPLLFTWKPMVSNPDERLPGWAYAQVVKWTSVFAAGAISDREVCDRIFTGLPKTGLKYGVAGWSPRQMILGKGGMCGGWYQLFQVMVHSQGVFVEKTAYRVHLRNLAGNSPTTPHIQWNAIVVSNGGINQPTPTVTASTFNDLATFPIPSAAQLSTGKARRYRFWGNTDPDRSDGHAINFLVEADCIVLYDASFGIGPIELSMALPPSGKVLGGAQLTEFVAKYLTVAVSHMLGSFVVNGKPMACKVPEGMEAGVNGVSVVTAALPEMTGGTANITFAWL